MKTLVDRIRNGMKSVAIGATIGLAAMSCNPKQAEGALVVDNFADLVSSKTGGQYVNMEIDYSVQPFVWDSLMIRDANTGVDSIVEGDWHMGFVKYVTGGAEIVGHAEQPYAGTVGNGFMSGTYYSGIGNGNKPEDVWLINDGNGDGIGLLYNDGTFVLGDDDTFYGSNDILLGDNQVRGDVSQLPIYTTSSPNDAILPHMIVFPIPEPATIGLLGLGAVALGLGRKRKLVEFKIVDKK